MGHVPARAKGTARRRGRITGFLVGALALALASSVSAGDPDLARFLLKHGKSALDKGDYPDALVKLGKARVEDAGLVEATYLIGLVYDKLKDKANAVTEYRRFLRATAVLDRSGRLDRSLAKLRRKAEARVRSLDAACIEFEKAQSDFADRLYAFARAHVAEDRELARRALCVLLAAHPDHEKATQMLEGLTPKKPPGPPAAPRERIASWRDLIKAQYFGRIPDWTYQGQEIVIKQPRGACVTPPSSSNSGPSYGYRTRACLDAACVPQRNYLLGLAFGMVQRSGYAVIMLPTQVVLETLTLGPTVHTVLQSKELDTWEVGTARDLEVIVDGATVQIYVDDALAIERKIDRAGGLGGDMGVLYENVHLTVRRLEFGVIEEADK